MLMFTYALRSFAYKTGDEQSSQSRPPTLSGPCAGHTKATCLPTERKFQERIAAEDRSSSISRDNVAFKWRHAVTAS